jgi:triacylglycerol lipase
MNDADERTRNGPVALLGEPIILVHGVLGYNELRLGPWTLTRYFSGTAELLQRAGNRVFTPWLSPTASIAARAVQLKTFIDRTVPDERVHIIAHSMGGLDARYMISRLGMAGRVRTLTTIATPHRGSPFADWSVSRFGRVGKLVLDWFDVGAEAFFDLTTTRCRELNDECPDAAGVHYFSVAGQFGGELSAPEWLLPYRIVLAAEGMNDGIVSITSATHGEHTDLWTGDHVSLVNWYQPLRPHRPTRDRTVEFTRLMQRLAEVG